MMRGKSSPSELILQIIKSNNSLTNLFFKNLKREIISLSNIILFNFFAFIFMQRENSAK